MRLLVGIDTGGSPVTVSDLLMNTSWPNDTVIRLVTVYDPGFDWMPLGIDTPTQRTAATERELFDRLQTIAEPLRHRGYATESVVARGRPADILLAEAADMGADLIVVGNRGHGAAASALLGSVSATLVDQAPCPVLVVRTPSVTHLLVATDGSQSADAIPSVLAAWGVFQDAPVDVLCVAPPAAPPTEGMLGPWWHVTEENGTPTSGDRTWSQQAADRLAAQLQRTGWRAVGHVRGGDPARVIEAAAGQLGADLIVTGSRGLTGIQRWVLGSVAHHVLLHSHCSVLVVRGAVRARQHRRVEVATPALAV